MSSHKAGDVFQAKRPYTSRKDGLDAKNRYFVYFGRSSILDTPVYYYLNSTTTQDIESKKEIYKNAYIEFQYEKGRFPSHCILILEQIDPKLESFFDEYNLEYQFSMNDEEIKLLLQRLDNADISPIIQKDIKASFERDREITCK